MNFSHGMWTRRSILFLVGGSASSRNESSNAQRVPPEGSRRIEQEMLEREGIHSQVVLFEAFDVRKKCPIKIWKVNVDDCRMLEDGIVETLFFGSGKLVATTQSNGL